MDPEDAEVARKRAAKAARKAAKKALEAAAEAPAAEAPAVDDAGEADAGGDADDESRKAAKAARKAAKKAARAAAAAAAAAEAEDGDHPDGTSDAPVAVASGKRKRDTGAASGHGPAAPAAPGAQPTESEIAAFRETNRVAVQDAFSAEVWPPMLSFTDAARRFPADIMAATKTFAKPSPIQAQCWPIALAHRDVVGIAATGSGKTLAFTLPALLHIKSRMGAAAAGGGKGKARPIMLVMAPTRELAMQVRRRRTGQRRSAGASSPSPASTPSVVRRPRRWRRRRARCAACAALWCMAASRRGRSARPSRRRGACR